VLAHELTHILDRDVRLLLVTILFVGAISFLAQLLWRSLRVISFGRSRRGGGGVVIFILAAAIVAAVGYLLALVLRFAISREREYLADAGSVDLTKHPEALVSALRKIATNPAVPHVPSEVRQMFIENPPSVFALFDTHPPIDARIKVLERLASIAPQASAATVAGAGAAALVPARASAGVPTAPGWVTGLTLAGSLGYAVFLLYASSNNAGFVEAVARQLAPVTDAVADVIPLCVMADQIANPALGITAVMIRHLFPILILVNTLFGLLSLGYVGVLATHYARRLTGGPGIAALFIVVYLVVAVLCFYPLAVAPGVAALSQQPIMPLSLGMYLAAAASPAVFFHCLRQMLALASAGRRIREANRAR